VVDPYYRATAQLTSLLAGFGLNTAADVGCGYAGITEDITTALPADATLYAVDGDPDVFPASYEPASCQVIELVQDVYQLELPTQVDAIVSRFLLLDLTNPLAAVRAMRHWIRPGGRLFLLEPITSTGRIGTSAITNASDEIFDQDVGLQLYDLLTALDADEIMIDAFTPAGLGSSLAGRYLAAMTGVDPPPSTFVLLPTLVLACGRIN
jgi:SAM-dependent methyltransferase